MAQTLFMLWFDPAAADCVRLSFVGDVHRLADGLWLARTGQTRSKFYHAMKRQLPPDTPLLVAPLDDSREGWPKFKGMDAGSLSWLRSG
jgi:hypothetical protein